MNYTLSEIARICGGTFTGENRRVTEVVTDSRSCGMPAAPLFVAMCGARHDSHDFVDGMYARGVRAFLVERPLDERDGAGYVVVGNAIDACNGWPPTGAAVSAVRWWGSPARTARRSSRSGSPRRRPDGVKLFRSPRSYNSQLGAALSLLMIEGDERFALIEAGISQPGEMARLERMISPTSCSSLRWATRIRSISRRWRRSAPRNCCWRFMHRKSSITAPTSRWLRCCARSMPRGTNSTMRRWRRAADWPTRLRSAIRSWWRQFWRVAGEAGADFGRLQRVAMAGSK